jgi:protein-S-isoprenylcysteine O-methyltransferase Ste14
MQMVLFALMIILWLAALASSIYIFVRFAFSGEGDKLPPQWVIDLFEPATLFLQGNVIAASALVILSVPHGLEVALVLLASLLLYILGKKSGRNAKEDRQGKTRGISGRGL